MPVETGQRARGGALRGRQPVRKRAHDVVQQVENHRENHQQEYGQELLAEGSVEDRARG